MNHQMPQVMRSVMDVLQDARERGVLILDAHDDGLDGRVGSIYLKRRVIAFLRGYGFDVEDARSPRDWYSMLVRDPNTNEMIPCNITISSGGGDNFTIKHPIVYSCTTLEKEDIPNMMGYEDMYDLVHRNLKAQRNPLKEYYMIFLHKRRSHVVVRSLCDVKYFRSNPSNHIQIEWMKEVKFRGSISVIHETPLQVFERVRNVLAESFHGAQRRMEIVTRPMVRSTSASRMQV